MTPDPRSGLDAEGNWTPAFPNQRPPFAPGNALAFREGNDLALRHGAYSPAKLEPRAAELADVIRDLAPAYEPVDEPMVVAFAMTLAQLERANEALARAKPGDLLRLSQDARGWHSVALKYANHFGMSPLSRSKLKLTTARTGQVMAQLAQAFEEADRNRE